MIAAGRELCQLDPNGEYIQFPSLISARNEARLVYSLFASLYRSLPSTVSEFFSIRWLKLWTLTRNELSWLDYQKEASINFSVM